MRAIGAAFLFLTATVRAADPPPAAWYRGNLHMHSLWSDGRAFPEDAVAWYRDHGYQLVCLSDHNLVQTDPQAWVEIGSDRLPLAMAESYLQRHAGEAETREENGRRFLRLKTIGELKRRFDQPGAFLLIPGQEMNRQLGGVEIHLNAVNVDETQPYRFGQTPEETIGRIWTAVDAWGRERGRPTLLMLNHPLWRYFDIPPEVLIRTPNLRFFELCNASGGPSFPPAPGWYSRDRYWDIVNAFRIADGFAPVFGLASDDTHNYSDPTGEDRPGGAWICVRAPALEPGALIQALHQGDVYASTGVALDDVAFEPAEGKLRVKVHPEPGVSYTIRFIATQAGFNRTTEPFDDPAQGKKPARRGLRYSDDIGRVVQTTDGTEADYVLKPDELYVRAEIVSSRKAIHRQINEPEFDTTWTQPYGWQAWQRRNPEKARLAPQ